jgi:hypothetical protein
MVPRPLVQEGLCDFCPDHRLNRSWPLTGLGNRPWQVA